MSKSTNAVLPPVVKSVRVRWAPEAAFRRFTEEIGGWWPLATHSVGQAEAVGVVCEGREGGRLYERHRDGKTANWGTITGWDPPRRFALTWHPGREPESAQDVEVVFTPDGNGTRVQLTHSGWERLGERAEEARQDYDGGWEGVLELYVG